MKTVSDMDNDPTIFRRYAEECKRLAKSMSAADGRILLDIAQAWLMCAENAEKRFEKAAGQAPRTVAGSFGSATRGQPGLPATCGGAFAPAGSSPG